MWYDYTHFPTYTNWAEVRLYCNIQATGGPKYDSEWVPGEINSGLIRSKRETFNHICFKSGGYMKLRYHDPYKLSCSGA